MDQQNAGKNIGIGALHCVFVWSYINNGLNMLLQAHKYVFIMSIKTYKYACDCLCVHKLPVMRDFIKNTKDLGKFLTLCLY